ncbi:MAG: Serine 3-dehydrogenase [Micavibrio sp.]|nr:Serine 3-dehydrogenase [Micavibrio sp.]
MSYPAFRPETVFITGVTGGFGSAMAKKFASLGCTLVLHARNKDKLDTLTATLNAPKIIPVVFDMGDLAAMKAACAGLPAIDVLVNNAGLALGLDPAQKANTDDWDEMIDTNIRALVHLTRLILPGMVERKRGHVINIGSVAGNWPYANGNVYGATKAFVRQFSLNLRSDLHGTNVRVTNIEPGLAETNFSVARFKGDTEKAAKVYEGTTPLNGDDIAESVAWVATLPAHVNINAIEIMPTSQSFGGMQVYREQ